MVNFNDNRHPKARALGGGKTVSLVFAVTGGNIIERCVFK